MASCVVPIYRGAVLEGVTGIDITIDSIVKNVLNLDLPWMGSAFLVDKAGVIIAMPGPIEEALGLKEVVARSGGATITEDTAKPEDFSLFKNRNPAIATQMRAIIGSGRLVNDLVIGGKTWFLTDSPIRSTGWHLLTLVDKATVRAPIERLDTLAKRFGYLAFLAMLAFYALFFTLLLYRARHVVGRIARPLAVLAEKSTLMHANPASFTLEGPATGIEEVDLLSANFRDMARELAALYASMEDKVEARTAELRAAGEELNQAYLTLARQEKMASIGQLAAGVAHEINNPMGFVMSNIESMRKYWRRMADYVKALLDRDGGDPKLQELRKDLDIDYMLTDGEALFQDTMEGASRIKAIVNELRSFARASDTEEGVDLNELVRGVLKITANEMRYRIEVGTDLGPLPPARCNRGQINQVLLNILMNAIQAIPDRGRIDITTRAEGPWIRIAIRDNGPGMPPEVLRRLFEPFFTTKAIGKGTGLGLAVSYGIVQQHGGDLEVASEVGTGTTFTVKLPVPLKETPA